MNVRRLMLGLAGLACLWLYACGKPQPPTQTEIQEFHAAVLDGDEAVVDRLLRAKPQLVNVPDAQGETPLKIAEQRGNDALVDVLKKHGGHE